MYIYHLIHFIYTFLVVFISNIASSQISSILLDANTEKPIPYVNIFVEHELIGTTSDINGKFDLQIENSKVVVFSAIGYEIKKIFSDSISQFTILNPSITELSEVIITAKKETKKLKIGKFKKSKINLYFNCGQTPWIIARYFPYKKEYEKTTFLNKIRISTNSNLDEAKFNLRLYSKDQNNKPGENLYDKNIIGTAKKGNKITGVDLSELNIQFPKDGFFIVIEWLLIESNMYTLDIERKSDRGASKWVSYEPAIGTVPSDTNKNSWHFNQGHWSKIKNTHGNIFKKT